MKKVVSFSLREETINRINAYSRITGKNRSRLVEETITDFHFDDETLEIIKRIQFLQEKAKLMLGLTSLE